MVLETLPKMSRPHAALELRVWALMAFPIGMLTGGVAGVLANTVFAAAVPSWALAIAVALLTGAGSLANVGSVFWAHWSLGRPKVPAVRRLQALFAGCLLTAAVAPLTAPGLVLLVTAIIAAQILWCGIVTIRASVWRLNYKRSDRTVFAARNQVSVSLIHAATAALAGGLVAADPAWFRWLLVLASLAALAARGRLRAVRVRRQRRLLAAERRRRSDGGFSARSYWSILRDDPLYRRYMICMMVLGSGNLMYTAPLILIMADGLGISSFSQVLVTAGLPTLIMPLATPVWARVLAREHVIRFRIRNSRWYAAAIAAALAGVTLQSLPVLLAAAVLLGIGSGGGTLGWQLGHNDFAPDERVAEYLGLHVSLTGIRGLLAPLIGVGLHGWLEAWRPGAGAWTLLLPLGLTTSGALGFWHLGRRHAIALMANTPGPGSSRETAPGGGREPPPDD
jgi:hypothetical protein